MNVSKEVAEFFYEQCAGEYSGHMSTIPNNPTVQGLLRAHGITNPRHPDSLKQFAEFCRLVAEQLDNP